MCVSARMKLFLRKSCFALVGVFLICFYSLRGLRQPLLGAWGLRAFGVDGLELLGLSACRVAWVCKQCLAEH